MPKSLSFGQRTLNCAGAVLICVELACLGARSQTVWPGAIVVKEVIDLNGNRLLSDSFDSTDPFKSTNGKYDASKSVGDSGDVSSIGGIEDSVGAGSAFIFGHVHTGPSYALSIGTGSIGSHVWQMANSSGNEPGWISQDANFTFPDTTLPDTTGYLAPIGPFTNITLVTTYITNQVANSSLYPSSVSPWTTVMTNSMIVNVPCDSYPATGTYIGTVTTNTGIMVFNHALPSSPGCYYGASVAPTTAGKFNYVSIASYTYTNLPTYSYATYTTNVDFFTNVYDFVLTGNRKYSYGPGFSGKRVLIDGPNVTLVLPNGMDGTEGFTWNNGATLIIHAGGSSVSIGGNNYLNPRGSPASFVLFADPTVTNLNVNANGQFTGVIVSPNAHVKLKSGGEINTDFSGSLMCNSVLLDGHFSFHFDESLIASLRSPISNPTRYFQFTVGGTPGLSYAVEASTNLLDWVRLTSNIPPFSFTDLDSASIPVRYYRVLYVP